MENLLTERQVAALLGVSISLLRKWRVSREGGPPYLKIGRAVRYSTEDLDAFVRTNRVQPADGEEVAS